MFPPRSKFPWRMLCLRIAYILCGKTNRVVWPWRLQLPGNNLMSPEPPLSQQEGLCPKCNFLQGQQVLATGAPGKWRPAQLLPNLRLPAAQADIMSQLARPLSCLLFKKGKQLSGGGGLESFWSPDPHEPRLPPPECPSTQCWDQTPYVFSASALRYWPALALSAVCSSSSNDTVFIKTIYMFSQIADIKENHPWELNKLS